MDTAKASLFTPAKGLSPCRELHASKENKPIGKLRRRSKAGVRARSGTCSGCSAGCGCGISFVRKQGVAKRVVGMANQMQSLYEQRRRNANTCLYHPKTLSPRDDFPSCLMCSVAVLNAAGCLHNVARPHPKSIRGERKYSKHLGEWSELLPFFIKNNCRFVKRVTIPGSRVPPHGLKRSGCQQAHLRIRPYHVTVIRVDIERICLPFLPRGFFAASDGRS